MQRAALAIPTNIAKKVNMTMDSDVCDTHGMNKMKFGGQVVCLRCFLENESNKLQQQEQAKYDADKANEKKFMFHKQSMIADSNIKKANFDNYQPTSEEGAKNLEIAKVIATDYLNEKVFNTIMAGNCEAGNRSPEEVDRRRHAVMAELREIHQLQLEGKWDATTWNGFGKGELHNGVAAGKVHEEIAS